MLLGVVLAFVPEKIAAGVPYIGSVVEGLESIFPAIYSLSGISPYPATMQLYLIVMWISVFCFSIKLSSCWADSIAGTSFLKLFGVCVVGFFMPLLFFFFLGIHEYSIERFHDIPLSRGKALISALTQYRLGTALLGSMMFCTFAAVFSLEINALRLFFKKYVIKNTVSHNEN